MQASVAAEIRWRLTLYRSVFDFCRQGKFTFARFLALVPDRLRLAVGESVAKMRVPVALSPSLPGRLAQVLPPPARLDPKAYPLCANTDALKRLIRFCQIDADLDGVTLAPWLSSQVDSFLNAAGSFYAKGLREVGLGEGGEETAYLLHLLLAHSVKSILERQGEPASLSGRQTLSAGLLDLAIQGVLSSEKISSDALSARLGFQFACTLSPVALGLSADKAAARPVNSYRTIPQALALAREAVKGSPEQVSLDDSVAAIAARLPSVPGAREALAKDALAELVRDCLLLYIFRAYRPDAPQIVAGLREIAASGTLLAQSVAPGRQRDKLLQLINEQPVPSEPPLPTLHALLAQAEAVQQGGTQGLGKHGDLKDRADLAAAGAVLLALDEQAETCRAEVLSRVNWVPQAETAASYEAGRSYWFGLEEKPLYKIPEVRHEAHLFVDVKDFTKRTASIKEKAMGDFLKRYFYQPIFELAARLQGPSGKALAISNIVGDAVAFRGEIVPMVALALGIRKILEDAEKELSKSVSDALGGSSDSVVEIDEELATLNAQLAALEKEITTARQDPARSKQLADQRKNLRERVKLLEEGKNERLERSKGLGLEAGAYIAYGAAAEFVDLSHPAFGDRSVTIAERLNEAARGTARSGILKAERDFRIARARKEQGSASLELPFQVSVGKSYALEVPIPHAESVAAAIAAGDGKNLAESVKGLSQWIYKEASGQIENHETDLPEKLARSAEFYNKGAALSSEALVAFQAAQQNVFSFEPAEVSEKTLPESFRKSWVFEYEPEKFLVVRKKADGAPVYILRFAGKALFKGFEKTGGIGVWEIILAETRFGQDLLVALGQKAAGVRPASVAKQGRVVDVIG
ncbi:MAG: hypothetical protein AB1405_15530 [Bdellovibrionota bacterium]